MTTLRKQPLSKSDVANLNATQVHSVLGRTMLVDGFPIVYDMDKSHDMTIVDAKTGKNYLDFFGFFASWPVGHNHPKMSEAKFKEKLSAIAAHNPSNSDIYTVAMAQFVATFERVAMPPNFNHLFFVAGGALAVENALKAAFDWKVRKNLAKGLGERGSKVIHFVNCFHGRSGYTMSLTNTSDPRKYMYFPRFDWPRIPTPFAEFPLTGKNLKNTVAREEQALSMLRGYLQVAAIDVACILLEPVQGEGGDNHFRPEFWQELRKLADEFEVLLIADEVQAGMGLTGKMWSYQHYGPAPDIICFGKKAQVCGIMATKRIEEVENHVFKESSRINSTWGGNLVDMVRSQQFLEIIEEENLVANAASVGKFLLEHLQLLQAEHPAIISNSRGKGLMCAFDCKTPALCNKIISDAYELGLMLISCGTQTIRYRPFLDCQEKHVIEMIKILRKVVENIAHTSKL